jgi:hypothetical protein
VVGHMCMGHERVTQRGGTHVHECAHEHGMHACPPHPIAIKLRLLARQLLHCSAQALWVEPLLAPLTHHHREVRVVLHMCEHTCMGGWVGGWVDIWAGWILVQAGGAQ